MKYQEQYRPVERRLAIIQHAHDVTGSVAQTSRYSGISRHTYYSYVRRVEGINDDLLDGIRERGNRRQAGGETGRDQSEADFHRTAE